jgi:hypothetical protein
MGMSPAGIGVGGVGQGQNGMDEWIQVGLTANPGDTTSRIYYEIARPSHGTVYRELSQQHGLGRVALFPPLAAVSLAIGWALTLAVG